MSLHSRQHHSKIRSVPTFAKLDGWQRGWLTRYEDEGATYAGAIENRDASISGLLVPTEITDEIRHRERKYEFVEIPFDNFDFEPTVNIDVFNRSRFWICRASKRQSPSESFPLPQTYVDTCLKGCLEIGGHDLAREFIQETTGWNGVWKNDRATPVFPRAAQTSSADIELIDDLLSDAEVLINRRNETNEH